MGAIGDVFAGVEDPRGGNSRHRLCDLLVMMVAASLCGASCATEFALFAAERRQALSRLMRYDRAPSHDTFSRLLRLIAPAALEQALARLAEALCRALAAAGGPQVVALDGKALRRAYEKGCATSPPLMVSAFAAEARLCLAAHAPEVGENEVEAALRIVELLDLAGHIVTADALHCHHRMAEALTASGADYLLAIKRNRHAWLAEAERAFAKDEPPDILQQAIAHDREESRSLWIRAAARPLAAGHVAFVKLVSRRNGDDETARFFLASRLFAPHEAAHAIRAHWQIENALHWTLDVHLAEDARRGRKDHAPANQGLIARLARNILQAADTPKTPISHRIKKCAWNDDYLIKAILHMR